MGVRRIVGVAVAVVVAASGLAGCSDAPTVGDGSLGVDWAVLPTPSVPVPPVGACTAAEGAGSHTSGWTLAFLPGKPVDCAQPHLTETYHVGVFPPDVDTDPNTVPTVGTARFRYAYGACLEQATEFLGRDPHTSRLAVVPVMPSERQWAGRARWFRCEVMELAGLDRTIASRTASLRDALAGDGPLTVTCADATLNESRTEVLEVVFTPCEEEHDVELTGAFTLPDGEYPAPPELAEAAVDGCRTVGAAYIGISAGDVLRAGSDAFAFSSPAAPAFDTRLTEQMWSVGERSAWCFYGSYSQRRTGSVRGLGTFPY